MSRVIVKTWLSRVCGAGLVLYPFVAYFSIYFHYAGFAVAYLVSIFFLYTLTLPDQRNRVLLSIGILLLSIGLIVWAKESHAIVWLYIPPVIFPLWASIFFLSSLRRADGAIVSRIAKMMEERELEASHMAYTRAVTLVWGLVLLGMAVEGILLAWLAPNHVWSWWVHIGNYFILLFLLCLEIPVRWICIGRGPQLSKMIKVMLSRSWNVHN